MGSFERGVVGVWLLVASGCAMGGEPSSNATTFGVPGPSGPTPAAGDDSDGSDDGPGNSDSDDDDGDEPGAADGPQPDDDGAPDPDGTDPDDPGNGIPATECGDGVAQGGEACDDGNGIDTDACKSDCTLNECGDGIVNPGLELCDDGNDVDDDACTNACTLTSCGDGVVQSGESCDDGNGLDNDGCLSTCVEASCGDGLVWSGVEDCDDANEETDDDCVSCTASSCGDGFVHATDEDCDPGIGGDIGCSNDCEIEATTFSYSFPFASPDATSCAAWTNFRDELSTGHTLVTMSGTTSPSGRTCTGAGATTICNALRNGTTATVGCDGNTWHVGTCSSGIELTADGTACACDLDGFAVRPCQITSAFGGLETNTCYAGAQTIEVTCSWTGT